MTELVHGQPTFPELFTHRSDSDETPKRRWPNRWPIPLGWQLFVLFLLCLIPRIWMASLTNTVCNDAYFYVITAAAFQEGNLSSAFGYLNLNIYPLILWGLHSLGLDWIFAGTAWSVLISSLAVLPLFGWIRRLFSDQVAWASCFLYSLHAEFVERSFEPMRDPTFWFLFNLCLYTTIRAVSEAKPRWFLANGLALTLAIHTRSEGWLLFIPLGLWLARQWFVKAECRKQLFWGTSLCLVVLPSVILLINLTILRDESEWQLGRLNHFAVGWSWLQKQVNPTEPSSDAPPSSTPPQTPSPSEEPKNVVANAPVAPVPNPNPNTVVPTAAPSPPAEVVATAPSAKPPGLEKYLRSMASALEQINLGLLVFGLCWSGRELFNWNRGVLFVLAFALAGAIWIVYNAHGHLNDRYFLPIYLALMPYFGIGYLMVFYGLWNGAERLRWSWLKPEYTALFLILLAIGLGWVDALITDQTLRNNEAGFGDWLEETHGPFHGVVSDSSSIRAAYHAQEGVPCMLQDWTTLSWQFPDQPRDLIILACDHTPPESRPIVMAEAKKWGLEPLAIPESVCNCDKYLVFIRPPKSAPPLSVAAQPQKTAAQ